MKLLLMILVLPLVLVSCAKDGGALDVNRFHLRNDDDEAVKYGMVRAEQRRALYGAVTAEERQGRLGEYFKIRWDMGALGRPVDAGMTEIVFRYHQAGTASEELVKRLEFATGVESGVAKFDVIGDDYLRKGRVLSWRVELRRRGEILDSRQSYMWE